PLSSINDRAVPQKDRWEFTRGFVEHVKLSARVFLDNGDLIGRHAVLRRLNLVKPSRHLDAVLTSPLMAGVIDLLLLSQPLNGPILRRLERAPALARLKGLSLGSSRLDYDGFSRLLRSERLAGLRTLNLCFTGTDDEDARTIGHHSHLRSLETLILICT